MILSRLLFYEVDDEKNIKIYSEFVVSRGIRLLRISWILDGY